MRVIDEHTLAFPSYDGNGTYLSLGNLLRNPQVGILFIDFTSPKRLRVNGIASIDDDDPLLGDYAEAQLIVRVRATDVLPNCPRYVHRLELVERSRFVPHDDHETPIPDWKRRDGRATCSRPEIRPTPSEAPPGLGDRTAAGGRLWALSRWRKKPPARTSAPTTMNESARATELSALRS